MGVSGDRSIPSCYDCDVEKISMTGGSFIRPELRFQLEKGVFLVIAYTRYCACSDLKNAVMLSIAASFSSD